MPIIRELTHQDHHPWTWWRRGRRWIAARVTARGSSDLGWGKVAFEPAVEALRDADLATIVTTARQCLTKRVP